jgi:hypothetical protein
MCGCRVGKIERKSVRSMLRMLRKDFAAHTKTDDAYTTEAATSIASRRVASRCRLKPLQCPRIQIQVCSVTTLARATERVRHTQDTPSFKRAWHKADERTRCRPGAQQAQRRRWPPARARARCSRGPRLLITRDARSNTGLFFVLSAQRKPCVKVAVKSCRPPPQQLSGRGAGAHGGPARPKHAPKIMAIDLRAPMPVSCPSPRRPASQAP